MNALCLLIALVGVDLTYVRDAFHRSLNDEAECKKLHAFFATNPPNDATGLAYKAANHAMFAQYVDGPIDKWNTLKEANAMFEKAVAQQPNDPEIRYLRVLIEENLPSFLPIDKHTEPDLNIIFADLKGLNDRLGDQRFKTAREFLLDDASLTKSQRELLLLWKP
jgi:hypothetical protein